MGEIRYDGAPKGKIPENELKYEWSLNKDGTIRELQEKVAVGKLKVSGHYDSKKNTTKIKVESEDGGKGKDLKVLNGLVVLGLKTEGGEIKVNY